MRATILAVRAATALAVAAPLVSSPVPAQATTARAASTPGTRTPGDAALDRAVAAYRNVRTMRASFEQSLVNPITSRTTTARGVILVMRPGRIDLRFTDPAGDRVVSDGRTVWLYLPSTQPGQAIRTSAAEGAAGLDVSTELLTAPRTRFTVSDGGASTAAGRPARIVSLVPRTPRAFTRARIWVDDRDGLVRQLELTEPSGLVRLVRFDTLQLNVKTPASAFRFTAPTGVRIVDAP